VLLDPEGNSIKETGVYATADDNDDEDVVRHRSNNNNNNKTKGHKQKTSSPDGPQVGTTQSFRRCVLGDILGKTLLILSFFKLSTFCQKTWLINFQRNCEEKTFSLIDVINFVRHFFDSRMLI
jgi:hypothetical protein